ncbi:MAG: RNA polymerase sigma factor [Candidatus Paceibacterota bacterium]
MERLTTGNNDKSHLSDEDILRRSLNEPWLFAFLVDRYEEAFMRKVRGIVRDPRDAEEIVLDTFTKIYVNAHSFTPQTGAKFSSWAYRILLNTAFTRYQKLVKEGQRFASLDPEFEQFVGEKGEHSGFAEVTDGVERILARLPEHFAYVLRLHYLEHWSHEDISKTTNEKVGTIKARIHRAKAAFRKESKDTELEALL